MNDPPKPVREEEGIVLPFLLLFLCTSIYTVLRYLIFGGVSSDHLPVFLVNKSVSMTAVISLLAAAVCCATGNTRKARAWRTAAWHSVCLHILLSISILSSAYYPKFFGAGKMNLTGEASMAFGVFGAYGFWVLRRNRATPAWRSRLQVAVTILIAGHLAVMGFAGWLEPGKWNGGMPPISLVSFIFAVLCFVMVLKTGTNRTPTLPV